MQPALRGLQHGRGVVHRDHARDKRCEGCRYRARPGAQIADDPMIVNEAEQRLEVEGRTEQLLPQAVPLPGRGREELLRFRPPLGEHALQAVVILRGGTRAAHLFAHEQPQPAGRRVEAFPRHRVEPARALRTRRDPPGVGQRLEVPADRGLRQLQHGAQLGDRQLMRLEQQEQPVTRDVGQCREVVEDGGALSQSVNPDGRIHAASPIVNQPSVTAGSACRRQAAGMSGEKGHGAALLPRSTRRQGRCRLMPDRPAAEPVACSRGR